MSWYLQAAGAKQDVTEALAAQVQKAIDADSAHAAVLITVGDALQAGVRAAPGRFVVAESSGHFDSYTGNLSLSVKGYP